MEFSFNLQEITFYALVLGIVFLFLASKYVRRKHKCARQPPAAAGSLPIIGHLHLLSGPNKLLHRTFAAMADKHGPIYSIQLGTRLAVVVSSWKVAKECFTTNDGAFPQRPRKLSVEIMGYDHAMLGFAPYGQYWRDMRKLAVVELLSNHRLELLKHFWETETNFFVKELYELCVANRGEAVVEMKERIGDLAMNIIVRMTAGKRYFGTNGGGNEESRRCQKALGDFFRLVGSYMVSDTIPFLGWLDFVNGNIHEMKKTARELDSVFQSWVDEHRQKRLNNAVNKEEQDFIHVMLSVLDSDYNKISAEKKDTIIKATCLSIILGGNDTSVVTLIWVISLLLNNRPALKRAQDEIDTVVGCDRLVTDSDIKELVYLQAIVKETLRLYPALPLSAPREAMKDCNIAGFHFPAGTQLLVNLWKLHRDPRIWSNPSEFIPERFLTKHASFDVRGRDFEYIPFGSGRRMCPGVSFGLRVVLLTLARLLQLFELESTLNGPVDMSESPGLTIPKATPLEVVLRPRLSSKLYED